jgi:hypothetical protein
MNDVVLLNTERFYMLVQALFMLLNKYPNEASNMFVSDLKDEDLTIL